MANETLGASFQIDITSLKTGLATANKLIRESNSEFQAAAAGMDDWSESEDGLHAKIKNLTTVSDLQRKKVEALQKEYDRLIADGLDPASAAAIKLRTDINNEQAALAKTEKEIAKQTKALDNLGKETDDTADKTEKMGKSFAGIKKAGSIAAGAVAAVGAACAAAVGGFLALGESTKETQTAFAKLDQSFATAGLSADDATDTIYGLYGVLGDMDRSTEAANLLAKMSDNTGDLDKNTRILTGVFAEFGDSIPTEGLAEGMQATAQMGNVQGVLADALEWQGINLDEYNKKLASMSTAEERAAYIQETLIGLYGESADAYRENNKLLIESNEAQLRLDESLAELGKIAIPIVTELKNLASELLQTITPFVSLIGEGLTGALDGSAGAADKLAEGLSGIVDAMLEKIVEMLPSVLEVIIQIVPKIIETILSQLPQLLQMVVDVVVQIIDALTQMLPTIVNAIIEIVPQLINSLIAAIPQLLKAAVQFLMAIIDAIPTIVTALLDALPDILETIVNVLIESIPILIDASIKMFNALIAAIPVIIQSLIENLPQIINTIIDGLINAMPLILDGSIQMLMAIIDAIPTIVTALVENLPQIINTITKTLIENLPVLIQASVQFYMGLIKAIPQIVAELVKNMPTIISTIVSSLGEGIASVKEVGGDLIRGLWEGISDMVGWIGEKIQGFGESILGGLKSFFGIASPSKVMANVVGKNLALGIGEGFEDSIGGVNDEIQNAMNFDDANVNVNARSGKAKGAVGAVNNFYQTNNFDKSKSRYDLYVLEKKTAAIVRSVGGGALA